MKSTFFLCVIFVLAACYSCSPVAKENKLIQGLQNVIEPQQRTRRSVDLVSGIANVLERGVPSKIRNKRSNNVLLNALTQFKEDTADRDQLAAELMASNLIDKFEEK